ncbi:MAG TPA: glycosyltransferase, partial [Bryobacteraceae bacterium]|nr:glycosyltransferase [Bryobacteraceae bacterium]
VKRARMMEAMWNEDRHANAPSEGALDLFTFPSQTDIFGNVVREALASGVTAVVTNQGGPKFLVASGVSGFVAADDDAFVKAVLSVMRDPELDRRMRQAAPEGAIY